MLINFVSALNLNALKTIAPAIKKAHFVLQNASALAARTGQADKEL